MLMKFFIPLFFILFLSVDVAFAQSKGKKGKDATPKHWDSPTRDPDELFKGGEGTNTKTSKKKQSKKLTPVDAAMVRYEQQKKANAKKYAQMEKDSRKPQYSDPSYFGHKKKPKKRPPGKRKFCQECGITH